MQVVEAFKILTSDKQVKAILVNIFGTHWLLPDHVCLTGNLDACFIPVLLSDRFMTSPCWLLLRAQCLSFYGRGVKWSMLLCRWDHEV